MEEAAIAFYKKASTLAANAKEQHFFDCLIRDEEEHFHIFQNTYSFLEDSGNWFMWQEQGLLRDSRAIVSSGYSIDTVM